MPRILIITQVFPPEIQATAVMVRELAEYLASHAWGVTVCAGLPHHPNGRLYPGWKWKLWQRSDDAGVTVLRAGHLVHPSRSIPVRASTYVTQALGTALLAAMSGRADVVLVYGPPLVGPCLGALVAARHRAKLVNVIYDIYPDIAVETGRVTNPLLISAARLAEKVQYRFSDMTVVLSEGFRRTLVAKGIPEDRIAVIPVWLDPDEIRPLDRDNAWRREQGISPDKFVVLYAGTIGVVSGASMVADAAALLRDRTDILFLFVGEGEEQPEVEARARELGLSNIRFLPFQPRERLAEMQATADVGLVTLSPGRGRTSVPSKVLGYMAAGRPVIGSVDADSDTAKEIETAACGLVVPPGDSAALAQSIALLADDHDMSANFGKGSRTRFESHYAGDRVLHRFERLLSGLNDGAGAHSNEGDGFIRLMEKRDCSRVSAIHLSAFEGFFLASLGHRLLRVYYETVIEFGQVALVSENGGQIAGFVTGIDRDYGFYKKLVTLRAPWFVHALSGTLVRNPAVSIRILRRLFERTEARDRADVKTITLTSIAVLPEYQGTGTAKTLLDAFKQEARARGFQRIELETDAEDNERVCRFYEREGFSVSREYTTAEGRRMKEYAFGLSDN